MTLPSGIIEFAASHQITFIVLGQSARSRMDEVLHGSIVDRIMRETRNIDVVIVAETKRAPERLTAIAALARPAAPAVRAPRRQEPPHLARRTLMQESPALGWNRTTATIGARADDPETRGAPVWNELLLGEARSMRCTSHWVTARQRPTSEEAANASRSTARNEIREIKGRSLILKFLENFYHLFAIMLWVGGILAFVGGMPELGWAIFAVIFINAIFSFWQEFRAEKATEALKHMIPHNANVIRDGKTVQIPAAELVPGDLMVLEEGDAISADARLMEEYELRTNNATLTGESEPVRKTASPHGDPNLTLIEMPNLGSPDLRRVRAEGRWCTRRRWRRSSARSPSRRRVSSPS